MMETTNRHPEERSDEGSVHQPEQILRFAQNDGFSRHHEELCDVVICMNQTDCFASLAMTSKKNPSE
jgi:hypothetical protein